MDELINDLKSKRQAQGLSIDDLFQRTRINTDFLEALEAGNFDVLPEAYIKLFLKCYAQEVKLDGDEIVRRFEQLRWKAKASAETGSRHEESDGIPGWVIGVGGALALAIGVAVIAWQSMPEPRTPPPVRQAKSRPARSEPLPSPSAQVTPPPPSDAASESGPPKETPTNPAPDPEPAPQEPAASLSLASTDTTDTTSADPQGKEEDERVVSAYSLSLNQDLATETGDLNLTAVSLEPTQITVISDGEPTFDGEVSAGRRTSWRARDRFLIEIKQGSGVRLQLQDEILPQVGADGRKVRLFISRSSIWVEEIESLGLASSTTSTP